LPGSSPVPLQREHMLRAHSPEQVLPFTISSIQRQENTLVRAKTIVRAKADVIPETTAAKARTLAKARVVARLQIAAVRAKVDAKPATAFSHIAGSPFPLTRT
jgi:hypothetical protein